MVKAWVATFICVGLIGAVNSVYGQVLIDTDTVIDAHNSFPDSSIEVIDGDNPPTIVEIVDGGVVWDSPATSVVRGSSIVNVSGGFIRSVVTEDSSTLNVSGGIVGSLGDGIRARGNSTVNFSGGLVDGGIDGHEAISAEQNSTVNITGGKIEGDEATISVGDSAVMNITGGNIEPDESYGIVVGGSGRVNMSGGQFDLAGMGSLFAEDSAEVLITGGTFFGLTATASSHFSILGGTMEGIDSSGESSVFLGGGSIQSLLAADSSAIEVHGSNLLLDNGRLTGVLNDGSMIDATAQTMGNGQILLVPEPSAIALLLTGFLVASFRRENTISSSSGNKIGGIR
jgi:hypothetical protein